MKKTFSKTQKVTKGMPTAVVLSILIYVGLFFGATALVIFKFRPPPPVKFEPPPPVKVPKMPLKKLQVKMRKPTKPKSSAKITAVVPKLDLHEIVFPDLASSGMGAGLGGSGEIVSFGNMPSFEDLSVFGGEQSIGNDFEGRFYCLARNRSGSYANMDKTQFLLVIRDFCASGWKESMLARYFRSPNKLYATSFMVPPIPSPMAPDVYGQPEMESYWFFVKYKGQLVYPEDIRFRFWGMGDAYIAVFVDGRNVFLTGKEGRLRVLDFWQNTDADNDKYFLANQQMRVGDWIELKAGEPLDMQVLFGEWQGGTMAGMLLVEVDGVNYPKTRQGGPLLPAFKTEEFTQSQIEQIRKYLPVGEASLTNGPVFRDFAVSGQPRAGSALANTPEPEQAPQKTVEKNKTHIWALTNGKKIEAEFLAQVAGKIILKTARGKQIAVSEGNFSEEDLNLVDLLMSPKLVLDFSKTSRQRKFPAINNGSTSDNAGNNLPTAAFFDFKVRISQTSPRIYPHELTVEFFTIAHEIDGDKRILLDYKKESFHMMDGRQSVFQVQSKTVQLTDYITEGIRRGETYNGHLIVVTDSLGEIVAYKASSKNLLENLGNLRKVPIGKYFDDDCIRCQSTRPKRFY